MVYQTVCYSSTTGADEQYAAITVGRPETYESGADDDRAVFEV